MHLPWKNSVLLAGGVLMAALFAVPTAAQTSGWLAVETNLSDAVAVVDAQPLGRADGRVYRVVPGRVNVRVAPSPRLDWSVAPIDTTIRVAPEDTLRLRLEFPYHYRVESVPFGAQVYLDVGERRVRIGETPVLHVSERPLRSELLIDEPGYAIARIEPGRDVWNVYRVMLEPTQPELLQSERIPWQPPPKRRWWIDAAALSVAAVGTVASVHYKFKADRLEEEREDACRADAFDAACSADVVDQIREYDRIAAWSLGTAQVGVGVFAIRLILR